MLNKFESNLKSEGLNDTQKEKPGIDCPNMARKIITETKQISDEEIKSLNSELTEFSTDFIDIGLERLKRRLSPEEFKEFNDSISRLPLVDLACGKPTNRNLFSVLFKEKFKDGDYNYYPDLKEKIDALEIAEPKEYIGVDKYHENLPPTELRDKIRFEQKDIRLVPI